MNSMRNLIKGHRSDISENSSDDFLEVLRALAHTLSQPLTSLQGSVEVALMGNSNESECCQILELVLQESRRMAEILEVLRELLEIEGSGEELQAVSWTQSLEGSLQ